MSKLPTIRPERTLDIRMATPISAIALSSDGRSLAVADYEQRLVTWSVDDGRVLHKHRVEASSRIREIHWSDDGKQLLLLVGSTSLWLVNIETGFMRAAWEADEPILDAVWSRDGTQIFGVLRTGAFFRFDVRLSKVISVHLGTIRVPKAMIRSPSSDEIALLSAEGLGFLRPPWDAFDVSWRAPIRLDWSPDEGVLAFVEMLSPSVIDVSTRNEQFTLEGHEALIDVCAFSADGRLLISADRLGVLFIWDLAGRMPVFRGRLSQPPLSPDGSAYHVYDSPLRLLRLDPKGERVLLYNLSSYVERPSPAVTGYLRHTSAKVVIAGEARVGKTSLAHRLVEDRYVEHESTHGVKFWSLPSETLTPSVTTPPNERREVVLWDLGGQEEYQLIHQLFLHDTTVALLLFDPARSGAALEEVEAWNKRLAKQLHGRPVRKLLVGTKQDAETPIDRQSIDGLVQRCGFEGFFATSAKLGHGLGELRAAVAKAIDWETLSTVSRPEVFQQVRDAIDEHRKRGEVVLHYRDLESELERPSTIDTVVRQLALQGVLAETRDAQGERTLILQVGEVDRYAGSLLLAARDSPSGVPALEKALLATRIPELPGLPAKNRLPFKEERWVLECVLQLMLEHGLCVEHAGLYVFPTCFRVTDAMPLEAPVSTPIFYEFSGAIDNIYSSLVAAFAVSKRFGHMRLGKDRAEFEGTPGSVCGLRKVDQSAGVAHLDVYFGDQTSEDARALFRDFVNEHLREHGVEMVERLNMKCSKCARPLDEHVLRERLALGKSTVICQLCDHQNEIALPPSGGAPSEERENRTRALRGEIAEGKRQAVDRARALIPREVAPPAQARAIRILHLSDLHISEHDDVDSLVGPLLADLQDTREGFGSGGMDYLVVSGDITNCASPAEMTRAYDVLDQLIDRLRLSAQRCMIVPGNHDLSWDEVVYDFKMVRQLSGPRDDRIHVSQGNGVLVRNEKRYPERFRSFSRHLFHPLFQREYPLDPQDQGLAALFPEHGLQFLAFNSAWEIDEHFPDRSAIHETALERCLKRASDDLAAGRIAPGTPLTRIAVWHHPLTGNAFQERLRQSDVRLCLHGHVHEDRADLVQHTDPVRKLYAVGAGSFGAVAKHRPESTPRLYNVIEIDPAHRWFRVHTRARPRSGGAWGPWANWPTDRPGERRAYYEVILPPPLIAR